MAPPPDDDRVTINVKSVSAEAWSRAKAAASRSGETMGEWLSRAATQLAEREAAAPREFPPLRPNTGQGLDRISPTPSGMTAPELADLMRSMGALAAATGTPPAKSHMRRAYGLADDLMRDACGLPRKPLRLGKAVGQSFIEDGKTVPVEALPEPTPELTKRRRRA